MGMKKHQTQAALIIRQLMTRMMLKYLKSSVPEPGVSPGPLMWMHRPKHVGHLLLLAQAVRVELVLQATTQPAVRQDQPLQEVAVELRCHLSSC